VELTVQQLVTMIASVSDGPNDIARIVVDGSERQIRAVTKGDGSIVLIQAE
jgi:hypothetical protein